MKQNKNIFIIILLILVFAFHSMAQLIPQRPYSQLEFIDLEPKWHYVQIDSHLISEELVRDKYFRKGTALEINPVVVNDQLITLFQLNAIQDYDGSIINSIDIHTGEQQWQYDFGLHTQDRQEITRRMYIDGNQIELLGSLRKAEYGGWPPGLFADNETLLTKRVLDLQTGTPIIEKIPDIHDESLFEITYSLNRFYNYYSNIFKMGDEVRYVLHHKELPNTSTISSCLLDTDGRIIEGFDTIYQDGFLNVFHFFKVSEDLYINIRQNPLGADEVYTLYQYDSELNEIASFPIRINIDAVQYSFFSYDADEKIIYADLQVYDRDDPFGHLTPDRKIWALDLNGDSLAMVYLTDDVITRFINVLFDARYSRTKKKFLVAFSKLTWALCGDPCGRLNFYENDESNENKIKLIRSFQLKDSLKYAHVQYIKWLENNDVIIYLTNGEWFFNEQDQRYEQDFNAGTTEILYIKAASLGLSSVQDFDEHHSYVFSLYPNPANTNITIVSDVEFDGAELFNQVGHRMTMRVFGDQMDISHLPAGMYYIYLTEKGRRVSETQKLVKIE
jgi:hypothetical protein